MSTILNLLCSICTEVFHNGDNIYSTSCGHVLHYNCLQEWLDRTPSCPQCRSPNPTHHKLYLSFDESAEDVKSLKAEAVKYQLEMNRLKEDVEAKDEDIRKLRENERSLASQSHNEKIIQQEESEILRTKVAGLEVKNLNQQIEIKSLADELASVNLSRDESVNELRNAEKKVTLLESHVEELQSELKNVSLTLTKEISKNVQQLSADCAKVSNGDVAIGKTTEDVESQIIFYKEKNKTLEQKLKHFTAEFEKEISKGTQLEIENMKLQKYVETLMANKTFNNNVLPESKQFSPAMRNIRNTKVAASNESLNSVKEKTYNFYDSSSNSVVVQKYPAINLHYPLENVIIFLARNMDISITKSDIDKVNIAKAKYKKIGDLVSLFVRFKTKDIKSKFLTHSSRLLVCSVPYLHTIQIREYIDNESQTLFAYANMKLNGTGFNHIFWTNNQIFAKRNASDARGIRILSRQQVDELVRMSEVTEKCLLGFENDNED